MAARLAVAPNPVGGAQPGEKRRGLRAAEHRLRVSFLLNTFLWTCKEKYSVFADGTAIQCNIAVGDSSKSITKSPLRGRINQGGNPRRGRVIFFCAAKRKSPKKRPPDALALRATLRSSPFWARAELAALRQPRASSQNGCGAQLRRRDPGRYPQRRHNVFTQISFSLMKRSETSVWLSTLLVTDL